MYAPSAGDIYALLTINAQYPGYSTAFIEAADGSQFMLTIHDSQQAATFLTSHPISTYINSSGDGWADNFNNPTAIRQDFEDILQRIKKIPIVIAFLIYYAT